MGFSIYGIGVSVLGYSAMGAGEYRVYRWLTVLWIPLVPLSAWVVRPRPAEGSSLDVVLGGDSFAYEIAHREPISAREIFRTYVLGWLLTAVAVLPLLLMGFFLEKHWPHGGAPWWHILLMVMFCVWPVFILAVLNHRQHRIHDAVGGGQGS
jgi:hypothetical protein